MFLLFYVHMAYCQLRGIKGNEKDYFGIFLFFTSFSAYAQSSEKLYSYKQFGNQYVVSVKIM